MNNLQAVLLALLVSTPAAAQQDMGSMPGMKMPTTKEPEKAPKRPRAFLRPAKPMHGMTMPGGHQKAGHHQAVSPASHGSMPGMDMGGPDTHHDMPAMAMPQDGKPPPDMHHDMPGMAKQQEGKSAPDAQQDMAGMDMRGGDHPMTMHGLLGGYAMTREASGTSWQPQAAPHDGIHLMADDWAVMLHGRVNGIADWQSGPRGGNQVFSSSMAMAMATRDLANGDTLGLKAMVSGDPFMGRRGYPSLLASGETADGVTHLVDRQHPHDLLGELAASYSHPLSAGDSVFLYGGYPGEPALGPSAYMHRVSALDNPMTPIAHHWLDSTHVAFGVVTAGWVHADWKLEVSQFTGREPDQFRFNFDTARFDSTAARLSWNPSPNWSLQVSQGWLTSPESLDPRLDERRFTASATWFDRFEFGSLAATLAFGNKHLSDSADESAGLAEAEYKPDAAWTVFARAETIQSRELVPGPAIRGAGEFSLGAIHDWPIFNASGAEHWKIGLGGLYAFDFTPSSTVAGYGADPHGAMGFVRLVAE